MSFASLNLLRSPSFLVTFLCFALKASLQQVSFAFLQLIPHSLIWKFGIVVPCAADTTDAMPALPCAPECVWSNSHATWPCNSAATLCDLRVKLFCTGFWCYIGDCHLQALLDSCLRTLTRNGLNGQVTPTHFFNNSCTETGGFRTVYQTVTSFPLQIDAHMT